ncbi:DUF2505 domain-containing protein [Mycolicibacterium gilvum]|uniref:Protein of uncharacterized function (DUF2505) n=1 Tax=Mycolicibacterium gilvum TaxID=1804 RepID=A0A378SML3_9MYCO|nr:DUF2505 domain-containing protein [Mycolicibacterium gilvum]MCV7056714.1 DUF2505 domain-containing protein [Mycolicibacterium gilvum]STZ43861.1 Protein of uncharacterised function (DUF2505) [Mycolicibacterium gilvum]
MARSFTGTAESTASVEGIHAAFGREDYWHDRLATGSGVVTVLDSLDVGPGGDLTVRYTLDLGRQLLPGPVAKLVRGGVSMQYTETWVPDREGRVCGNIAVAVSGGLGSCDAQTWLRPAGYGSQLRFAGRVTVRIPLVGGNLEKSIGADLAQNIPSVLDFTASWIGDHA